MVTKSLNLIQIRIVYIFKKIVKRKSKFYFRFWLHCRSSCCCSKLSSALLLLAAAAGEVNGAARTQLLCQFWDLRIKVSNGLQLRRRWRTGPPDFTAEKSSNKRLQQLKVRHDLKFDTAFWRVFLVVGDRVSRHRQLISEGLFEVKYKLLWSGEIKVRGHNLSAKRKCKQNIIDNSSSTLFVKLSKEMEWN